MDRPAVNLLPCDGTANYLGPLLGPGEALDFYHRLMSTVPWQHDEVVMFGKRIVTARKVAWYADAGISYRYSGTTKQALDWSPVMLELKRVAEARTAVVFNSCLLNLYHDGSEGMGWHSDDEKSLLRHSCIASLSFGAPRKFAFKHKRTGTAASLILENGSLLVMKDETQAHWLHSLPKSKKVGTPRINLTFRQMAGG